MTLKSPLATRSISSSISCSVEVGEFKMRYVEGRTGGTSVGGVAVVGGDGAAGGRREKSDAEGAMNERYWSRIYLE